MAVYGIGKTKVDLKLVQNGSAYQTVCRDINIQREPGVASKLTTSIYRDSITAEVGDLLFLTIDDSHQMFKGIITETTKSEKWCGVTAYDQIYYLNKSHIYYTYEEQTASDVVKDMASREQLTIGEIMGCSYTIPYRIEDNATPLDIIDSALELEFKNTGTRYFLWDDYGKLSLSTEKALQQKPFIVISMGFIEDYSYGEDMNDIYTKVTVVSQVNSTDEATGERTFYTKENAELIKKYGLIEYATTVDQEQSGDQIASQLLEDFSKINQRLTISKCQGDPNVIGGTPVYVDFYGKDNLEYIRGFFRAESVTHTISEGHHTMDLDLSLIEMNDNWSSR